MSRGLTGFLFGRGEMLDRIPENAFSNDRDAFRSAFYEFDATVKPNNEMKTYKRTKMSAMSVISPY